MGKLVMENITMAREDMTTNTPSHEKKIMQNETVIDFLADAISDFLVKLNVQEISTKDAKYVNRVYQALNDLERIGDYAEKMLHLVERGLEQGVAYSGDAQQELSDICDKAVSLYTRSVAGFYGQNMSIDELKRLARLQREIRRQANQSQENHMQRMRKNECSSDAGILFGEMLNCLSRIGGHAINIAEVSGPQNG